MTDPTASSFGNESAQYPNTQRHTPQRQNLRVTFWGVQGSCPIFPTQGEVDEYCERVAAFTVQRTLADIAQRMETGECTPQMLRAMATPRQASEYQRKFGLPKLPVYGGDTTCIEVQTCESNTILFDMGSGIRDFSRRALSSHRDGAARVLHVFATHEHLDHRNGLPFASVLFDRKNPYTVHIYGTRQVLTALDDRYGIYSHRLSSISHIDDPLDYSVIAATFTGTEICTASSPRASEGYTWPVWQVGVPIQVGATTVTPFEVYHGITQCLAYKVQHGPSSFVFCTDHELRHGSDPADPRQVRSIAAERRLLEYCQNADVVYFDGQYFLDEYTGQAGIGSGPPVPRMDWGHSCIEDVISRVQTCNIRRAFIGHHDPERLWGERFEVDQQLLRICAEKPYQIELAKAGNTIVL